jgi:hypothetical protein
VWERKQSPVVGRVSTMKVKGGWWVSGAKVKLTWEVKEKITIAGHVLTVERPLPPQVPAKGTKEL